MANDTNTPAFRLTTDARILSVIALGAMVSDRNEALDQDIVQDELELDARETAIAQAKIIGSLRAQMGSFVLGGKVEAALVQLLGAASYDNLLRDLAGHILQTLII
jgi:hypothetical protein